MREIEELRKLGFNVEVEGEDVWVRHRARRPPAEAEPLLAQLQARLDEVLLALRAERAEVEWRARAMRKQVPPAPSPIPILAARRGVPAEARRCPSCGEPLPPRAASWGRCAWCLRAAQIAVH